MPISVSFGADCTVEDAAKCAPNGSFGRLWDDRGNNKEMKNDAKIERKVSTKALEEEAKQWRQNNTHPRDKKKKNGRSTSSSFAPSSSRLVTFYAGVLLLTCARLLNKDCVYLK